MTKDTKGTSIYRDLIRLITSLRLRNYLRRMSHRVRPFRLLVTPQFLLTENGRYRKSGLHEHLYTISTFSDSPVVDIGAYKGDFLQRRIAMESSKQYYGFEPVEQFFLEASELFLENRNVTLFNYGLSSSDENVQFSLSEDATGVSQEFEGGTTVRMHDIATELVFLQSLSLVVCNIEGGEYSLIQRLVDVNLIQNIEILLLQFHNIDKESRAKMKQSRALLAKTHFPKYTFDFIWDVWIRKDFMKTK